MIDTNDMIAIGEEAADNILSYAALLTLDQRQAMAAEIRRRLTEWTEDSPANPVAMKFVLHHLGVYELATQLRATETAE